MFRHECDFYTKVYPKMSAYAANEARAKLPKCYLADDESGVLFMENLKDQGFILKDKKKSNWCW